MLDFIFDVIACMIAILILVFLLALAVVPPMIVVALCGSPWGYLLAFVTIPTAMTIYDRLGNF